MAIPFPLHLTPPPPSNAVGFGIPIEFDVDANYGTPGTSFWTYELSIQPLADELIFSDRIPYQYRTQTIVPLLEKGTTTVFGAFYPSQAQQVYLHATLEDTGTPGLIAEGQIQAPWSNDQGLAVMVNATSGVGQGLTEQEHTWLDNVQLAVQSLLRDSTGLALSTPIGALIAHPDVSLFDEDPAALTLVGRGVLTRASGGVGVNAYGLLLSVAQRPPGFGTEDGQLITFESRIGQLVTLHRFKSSSVLYPTETFDLVLDSFAWVWRNPFPSEILYDITPGCVVAARWLVVNIP